MISSLFQIRAHIAQRSVRQSQRQMRCRCSLPRTAASRTGSIVTELLFAFGVIAILTAGILPAILMTRQAESTSAEHTAALLELNSVLDRFSALPFEQITPEAAKGIQASKSFANRLTGVVLAVTVTDVQESTGGESRITGRRILARAEWPGRNGIRHSRSLATWVFSDGRGR